MMPRLVVSVALLAACVQAFSPCALVGPRSRPALRPTGARSVQPRALVSLRMQSELPPGWQQSTDPASGREFYYNAETGVTSWDPPAAEPEMSSREKQMAAVMERQRIQDADKQKRGALALESNRVAVILGTIFIVLPVIFLAVGYVAGVIPNPFEVCVQGGSDC